MKDLTEKARQYLDMATEIYTNNKFNTYKDIENRGSYRERMVIVHIAQMLQLEDHRRGNEKKM